MTWSQLIVTTGVISALIIFGMIAVRLRFNAINRRLDRISDEMRAELSKYRPHP